MKNDRAQPPENLALTKILQNFRKTSTPLGRCECEEFPGIYHCTVTRARQVMNCVVVCDLQLSSAFAVHGSITISTSCPFNGLNVCSASDPAAGGGGWWVGKKQEIYMAAFGSHLIYDLFVHGWGDHGPLGIPPGSATAAFQGQNHKRFSEFPF